MWKHSPHQQCKGKDHTAQHESGHENVINTWLATSCLASAL